jgi:hypothetical protein
MLDGLELAQYFAGLVTGTAQVGAEVLDGRIVTRGRKAVLASRAG